MVGKRRRAREIAMQMLYQQEMGGTTLAEVFKKFDLDEYLAETDTSEAVAGETSPRQRAEKSFEYARSLVEGTLEHSGEIDDLIRRHAENWRLERMPTIDRNILRLAIYEMHHESTVPKLVIVDEAIELAKKFGSENSSRFINGLLDGILQSNGSTVAVATEGPQG